MQFEVFIPSDDPDGFDVTIRVESQNWMQALKSGLQETYGGAQPVRNVMCDIKEDGVVRVTDLESHRVFRIRPLSEEEATETALTDTSTAVEAGVAEGAGHEPSRKSTPSADVTAPGRPKLLVPAQEDPLDQTRPESRSTSSSGVPVMKSGSPLGLMAETGLFMKIGAYELSDDASMTATKQAQMLEEKLEATASKQKALRLAGDLDDQDDDEEEEHIGDSAIEDVFLEINDLYEGERTLESAVSFCLDLALRHVQAESGSVFFADETGSRLYFAAARGPKAEQLLRLNFTIPVDVGIVGFCTREALTVSLSNVTEDSRFFSRVSDTLQYASKAILCAPIQCEGQSFGAIELINHKKRSAFNEDESSVLTYIANQAGRFIVNLL